MAIIKPSTAFKQSADWVSGEVRAYMRDQVSTHVDTVQDVRDNDFEQTRFVYVRERGAVYRLDLASGAADNGNTVIRDNVGRRYIKVVTGVRDVLTATRTLYVRTDGNNNNDGLTNTSGGAFATIQHAFNIINATDLRHYNVTVKLGNTGNFAGATLNGPFLGSGTVALEGDVSNPANTTVTSTIAVNNGGRLTVRHFRITTVSGGGLLSALNSVLTIGSGINFGSVSTAHMHARDGGVIFTDYGNVNYTISGSATQHIQIDTSGVVNMRNGTVTLTGTPAWSFAFVVMTTASALYMDAITFNGGATGSRYYVSQNSVCVTGGGGASYFPGSSGGSTPNGGLYI